MQTGSGSASSRDQRGADGACGEAAGVCRVVFREYISFVCEQPGPAVGAVSLSVSEMALYILAAVFLLSLAATVRKGIHGAVPWLSCILLAAGILAFLYTICCGINYHRKSFSEEEGIVTYRYTAQDLKEVCPVAD